MKKQWIPSVPAVKDGRGEFTVWQKRLILREHSGGNHRSSGSVDTFHQKSESERYAWYQSRGRRIRRSGPLLVRSQEKSVARRRRCVLGSCARSGTLARVLGERFRNGSGSKSSNVKFVNESARMKFSVKHRLFSHRRSSTADQGDGGFLRQIPKPVRGRADMRHVAYRPCDLLRAPNAAKRQIVGVHERNVMRIFAQKFVGCGTRIGASMVQGRFGINFSAKAFRALDAPWSGLCAN